MYNPTEISVNVTRLLDLLAEVCDKEALSKGEELAAVSMLLSTVAAKYGLSKEETLLGMGYTVDQMNKVLAQMSMVHNH
jgi:hypothetical protein